MRAACLPFNYKKKTQKKNDEGEKTTVKKASDHCDFDMKHKTLSVS